MILRGITLVLAVFYLVMAWQDFLHWKPAHWLTQHLDRKPFNCTLCMSFWLIWPLLIPQLLLLVQVLAVAGAAVFVRSIYERMRVFIS